MKKMYMTKTIIYSMLTVYFFAEMFWPLGQSPQWLVITAFSASFILYLDNLLTWWMDAHETRTRN